MKVTVADAASSRYRGRISMEVIRELLSVSDLENHLIRIGFRENNIELSGRIFVYVVWHILGRADGRK